MLYRRKDEAQKLRLNFALFALQPTVMDFRDKSDENVPHRMRQERRDVYLMGNTLEGIAYIYNSKDFRDEKMELEKLDL